MATQPKLVLFDFDDTLVDTYGSKIPAIIEYCQLYHDANPGAEAVARLWGIPFSDMISRLTGGNKPQFEEYLKVSERFPLLAFNESERVLQSLRTKAVGIGIITSLSRPVLEHSLRYLEWNMEFAILVAEGEAPANKPDPRVFNPVFDAYPHLAPSEMMYVGDSLSDATAAIEAGIPFVGVARDAGRRVAFAERGIAHQESLLQIARPLLARELQP
jgi:phosphoglycolate phosphatase